MQEVVSEEGGVEAGRRVGEQVRLREVGRSAHEEGLRGFDLQVAGVGVRQRTGLRPGAVVVVEHDVLLLVQLVEVQEVQVPLERGRRVLDGSHSGVLLRRVQVVLVVMVVGEGGGTQEAVRVVRVVMVVVRVYVHSVVLGLVKLGLVSGWLGVGVLDVEVVAWVARGVMVVQSAVADWKVVLVLHLLSIAEQVVRVVNLMSLHF